MFVWEIWVWIMFEFRPSGCLIWVCLIGIDTMIEVLNPLTMSDWMRLQVTRSRKIGNALKGAGFISTVLFFYNKMHKYAMCQCPEWGDLHFHVVFADGRIQVYRDVSMPWMGRPSFPHTCFWEPAWIKGLRTRFCKYFPEYSEKGVFEGKIWHVQSLFIFSGRNEGFSVFHLKSL